MHVDDDEEEEEEEAEEVEDMQEGEATLCRVAAALRSVAPEAATFPGGPDGVCRLTDLLMTQQVG